MKYLAIRDVLLLHQMLIDEIGGSYGLRDYGLIESAVLRPQTTFDGKDLYPTLYLKAASPVHSILLNHAFVDGNKRTAMFSLMTFIELNNYIFEAEQKEVVRFAIYIENQKPNLEEIAEWIKNHTKKKK